MKKLIVDTNIMFSVLLGKSKKIREILFSSEDFKPYSCKFSIVELFKRDDIALALSTGTPGPFGKITAMIMDSNGHFVYQSRNIG